MPLWVFLLALGIGEGELEVSEKGSTDPEGRNGSGGVPPRVAVPYQQLGARRQ